MRRDDLLGLFPTGRVLRGDMLYCAGFRWIEEVSLSISIATFTEFQLLKGTYLLDVEWYITCIRFDS